MACGLSRYVYTLWCSASAQDYYGTCGGQSSAPAACSGATWPSTGWTRPLFDLNYSTPARGDHVIISVGAGAFSPGQGYITIDDLEIAHQAITGSATDVISGTAIALGGTFATDASVGTIVENCSPARLGWCLFWLYEWRCNSCLFCWRCLRRRSFHK